MPETQEDIFQHRLQRLTETQRQNAEDLRHVDSKVDQIRHDFREAMTESALIVQSVMQEVRSLTHGLNRISNVVFDGMIDKLEGVNYRFQKSDEVMHQIVVETDR